MKHPHTTVNSFIHPPIYSPEAATPRLRPQPSLGVTVKVVGRLRAVHTGEWQGACPVLVARAQSRIMWEESPSGAVWIRLVCVLDQAGVCQHLCGGGGAWSVFMEAEDSPTVGSTVPRLRPWTVLEQENELSRKKTFISLGSSSWMSYDQLPQPPAALTFLNGLQSELFTKINAFSHKLLSVRVFSSQQQK